MVFGIIPERRSDSSRIQRSALPDSPDPITNQRKAEGAGAEEPRYRLPHERLIPVLRRLTGAVLAQLDQTRLLFQDRFAHWKQTGSSQYLLRGEDLRRTKQFRDALLPGADAAQRIDYFRASLRRRIFCPLLSRE